MKKGVIVAAMAALVTLCHAGTITSTAEGGDWNSPDSWAGGESPTAGDNANILGSATMTLSAGETVTNVFISLYRDASGGAQLNIASGACVTNCCVRFGVASGTPAENATSRVVLEPGGLFVKDSSSNEFTTYAGNVFEQRGGLVQSDVNESFSAKSLYDQKGGTNRASIIQISAATFAPETFTNYHLHSGARLDIGSFMVSGGTALMEGDWNTTASPGERGATQFYAGGLGNSFGRLLFSGVTNEISTVMYAGCHSSQTRQNPTGVVDIVNSEIVIATAPVLASNTGTNGRGVMRLDNSRVHSYENITLLDGSAMTALNGRTASLVVTNNSILAIIPNDFAYDPWTCSDSEFFAYYPAHKTQSRGLTVNPGGDVFIENGIVRVSDRIFVGGGRIRIGRGGRLACYRFFSHSPSTVGVKTVGTGEIVVEDGGELYVNTGDFCIGPVSGNAKESNVCDQTLHMKGGTLNLPAGMIKLGASNNTTRFEVSGGTLPSNAVLLYMVPGSVEVAFKGSAYTADISGVSTNTAGGFTYDDVLLEFTLDKSPRHIRAVNMSGSNNGGRYVPRRCGNLRVKLDGGILVTDRDEFALLTTSHKNSSFNAFGGAGDFVSLPDPHLWEEVLSSNSRTCSVRLVSTELTANWKNGVVTLPSAMSMGSIQLANVRTNNMSELKVQMSVTAADGSALGADALSALRDGLVAAGYTNSVCSVGETYNLTAAVPSDVIGNGDRRFVWDFTETKGIKTVGTVVTNALVTSVAFSPRPIVPGFKIIVR